MGAAWKSELSLSNVFHCHRIHSNIKSLNPEKYFDNQQLANNMFEKTQTQMWHVLTFKGPQLLLCWWKSSYMKIAFIYYIKQGKLLHLTIKVWKGGSLKLHTNCQYRQTLKASPPGQDLTFRQMQSVLKAREAPQKKINTKPKPFFPNHPLH